MNKSFGPEFHEEHTEKKHPITRKESSVTNQGLEAIDAIIDTAFNIIHNIISAVEKESKARDQNPTVPEGEGTTKKQRKP